VNVVRIDISQMFSIMNNTVVTLVGKPIISKVCYTCLAALANSTVCDHHNGTVRQK